MLNPAEPTRLAELRRLNVLNSAADKIYDDLTKIAAQICGTAAAMVSLVDSDRQWFKSRVGIQASEIPREFPFCSYAIETPDQIMVVSDASKDGRFRNNPLVLAGPRIRFYAGAPVVTRSGHAVGTLCVLDTLPRVLDAAQLDLLRFLAVQVVQELELHADPTLQVQPTQLRPVNI